MPSLGANIYRSWPQIIEVYSRCNMTMPKDKLVAISGLAKIAQETPGDQYLAGIWRRHLPAQLLWSRLGASPVARPVPYRAPSWSWASVDGLCNTMNTITPTEGGSSHKVMIDIQEATTYCVSEDTTGEVKGGHITLRGLVLGAECDEAILTKVGDTSLMGKGRWKNWVDFDVKPPEDHVDCYSLVVSQEGWGPGDGPVLKGLLLEVEGSTVDRFRRCGSFFIYIVRGENHWLDVFKLGTDRKYQAPSFRDGTVMQTITIV